MAAPLLKALREWPRRRPALIAVAWLTSGGLALLALVQHVSGLPFSKTLVLDEKEVVERAGSRVRVRLPSAYRHERFAAVIRIQEDGRPLPHPPRPISEIETLGRGRHKVRPGGIHLSATDGSIPFENGRRYTARVPVLVGERMLTGFFLLFLATGVPALLVSECREWLSLQSTRFRIAPGHPGIAVLVFAAALVTGTAEWMLRTEFDDGFFTVRGSPHSDSMGWNENAISLKQGHGFVGEFRGHRGGYPLFLGCVYTFFGDPWPVAKACNVVLLATATVFLYLLGSAARSPWMGLAMAGWTLVDPASHAMIHRTLTENLAFALNPPALLFLLTGFRKGSLSAFAAAGFLLGWSNLSRPFTLFGVFFYALLFLWLLFRDRSWTLPRILRTGTAFSAGLLLVFFPWCLRQKLTFGSWSPSANGPVAMFAAASPMGHTDALNQAHYELALAAGIPKDDIAANQAFFQERFSEAVRADPTGYVARLGGYADDFFGWFNFRQPWQLALLTLFSGLLVVGAAWRQRRPWLPLLIPLVPAAVLLVPEALTLPVWILLLLVVAVSGGLGGAVIAATVPGAVLLNVIVANFALNRSEFLISSLFLFVALAALDATLRRTGNESRKEPPAASPWTPLSAAILGSLALVLVLGLSVMGIRTLLKRDEPWQLDDALPREASLRTAQQVEGLRADDPRLRVVAVSMTHFRHFFSAEEDAVHISRAFAPRPEDRTVIFPRVLTGKGRRPLMAAGQVSGPPDLVPRRGRFLIVGLVNDDADAPLGHGRHMLEVLAFYPLQGPREAFRLGLGIYPPRSESVDQLMGRMPEVPRPP